MRIFIRETIVDYNGRVIIKIMMSLQIMLPHQKYVERLDTLSVEFIARYVV